MSEGSKSLTGIGRKEKAERIGNDMKWIYGKQELSTLERGQENCYLLTNGLGGFSTLTMTGSAARNDHALLMACTQAPNHRYNMIHRLKEELTAGEERLVLSSQEFAGKGQEEGFRYLSRFTFEDTPVWLWQARGVEIRKEIGMAHGKNSAAVRYEIRNRSREDWELTVTPFLQFVRKGSEPEPGQSFSFENGAAVSNGLKLYVDSNGTVREIPVKEETYFYSYDIRDGRRPEGLAKANHTVSLRVPAGETGTLDIVWHMEPESTSAEEIIRETKERRRELERRAGFSSRTARTLSKSADQFVSERESTGGKTILAGFPFFEDWGRDTMIALPGICISTGQYETAKEILRTFALNERDGLMPNLFPEGGNEPMYNTVDAALLFINCVYLYWEATGELEFAAEMYPVMERIMKGYREGTAFGIHMDQDGLIAAGEGLAQVTWMDVRVGEILPTPRHGKPVEINAYWYNALRIMEKFAELLGKDKEDYGCLAKKVKEIFPKLFWMEEHRCLKDLVSGTAADRQIRCNQIWAVSMPFTMLDEEKERKVVETVFEKLYTPYGLRTLEMSDPEFHPAYGGAMMERDLAYHQGTVWTFPLGAYYLAYLKVNRYSEEAKAVTAEQLEALEAALREGCIGQLPEIYDGENPTASRGCFAQAWSVGELLRVYELLEKEGPCGPAARGI